MSKLAEVAAQAVANVAPQWPLPQWVAVNPLWEFRHRPLPEVAAEWRYCGDVALTMSAEFYLQQAEQGGIDAELISEDMRLDLLKLRETPRFYNISHLVDRYQQRRRKMLWHDEVVFQISQSCGLFMQFPRRFQGQGSASSLYQHWLTISRADRGIETLMDEEDLNQLFAALPDTPAALFQACEETYLASAGDSEKRYYCQALLTDVLGWAAALSYQDRRYGSDWLIQLLAIRMAWDFILWQLAEMTNADVFASIADHFRQQSANSQQALEQISECQAVYWQWQKAYEKTQLKKLQFKPAPEVSADKPELQAVFCIDVRSERYRRALQATGQAQGLPTRTKGFAGFFGVPLGREDEQQQRIPHVPGLLSPSFYVKQQGTDAPLKDLLSRAFNSPASMFTGVEALGLSKLVELIKGKPGLLDTATFNADSEIYHNGQPVTCDQLAEMCAQALAGMQFTEFAEHVVLVGHGAKHSNNAQRAGMNCGACGGQTGALSARVLCHLLNQSAIRQRLSAHGYNIPSNTVFYAALHETVTDEVIWLSDDVPEKLQATFKQASGALQQEHNRATRANHWAELRPEWGLAGNQALFFGNARRLSEQNPQGHTFLHDYDAQRDTDGSLLTALLSAPGLVANWINWQYYTAVTEPARLGSGNKLLHNRVANDIGVFEGNGGDLRLGLAWQSVHDGEDFVHKPLRLSVIIEADDEALIHKALAQASDFNQLYQHQWIDVYRLNARGDLCPIE